VDALTRITLDIAADLLQPMLPSQVQATALARLDAAGFGAACLRVGAEGLHWACDGAHLAPGVLAELTRRNRNLVGGWLSAPLEAEAPFAAALGSLTPGILGVDAQGEARGQALLEALGAWGPVVYAPVAHNGRALGLLLIWGEALTPDCVPTAERLGRMLGSAIARADAPPAAMTMTATCQEALHVLQAVIATLSVSQPLEQSLAAIRDTMPKLMPGWLPPLFAVRDFEADQWVWRPFLPAWAAQTLEERTGVSLDGITAPVGESPIWSALSQGQAVFTQDPAELVGHVVPPEQARAMQRALGIRCTSAIPLYRDGEVLGLMFAFSQREAWSQEEKDLLRACAANVALALQNARFYERQQRMLSRVRVMLDRAERVLLPAPATQRFQAIVDEAVELLSADAGALYATRPDGSLEAVAYRGISDRYVRMVCENYPNLRIRQVMDLRMPARIPDMTDDPHITGPVLQAVVEEGLRSMIALPLAAHGILRGVLVLYRRRPTPFSDEAMLAAHAYAVLGAVSYETLVQRARAERQVARLAALTQIIRDVALPSDPDRSVFHAALEHACRLTESQHAKLYLWDAARHALVEQAGITDGQRADQGFVLKAGEGLAGSAFARGRAVFVGDYMSWSGRLQTVSNPSIGPSLGVPIRLGEEVIGALVLGRTFPALAYDDEDAEMAEMLADEMAVYVAKMRTEQERDRQRAFAQRILDAMRAIVLVLDPETTLVTHANRYVLEKTGWSREEVVGKPWVDTFVPATWRDRVKEVARRLREQNGGYRFANPILTKDGRELFVEWHNTVVRDEEGKALYLVASGVIAGD